MKASATGPADFAYALGSTFIDALTDHDEGAALRIGKDVWSKHDVAVDLGVVHTRACSILSTICRRLKVASTRDLFNSTSPYTFTEYPAGVTTLYVMFAAFRDKDLDPNQWYAKGQEHAVVTFFALKHREQQAARRTRRDQRSRVARGRDKTQNTAANQILKAATA